MSTVNEFRCYEVKTEESEKAGSHRESNPGHLWLEPPVEPVERTYAEWFTQFSRLGKNPWVLPDGENFPVNP